MDAGRPILTQRDWLLLFGHPSEKTFSLHMWLRFAVLWFAAVLIGFVEGIRSLALWSRCFFVGAVFLIALVSLAHCAEVVRLIVGLPSGLSPVI
jgi:hypothetical protein